MTATKTLAFTQVQYLTDVCVGHRVGGGVAVTPVGTTAGPGAVVLGSGVRIDAASSRPNCHSAPAKIIGSTHQKPVVCMSAVEKRRASVPETAKEVQATANPQLDTWKWEHLSGRIAILAQDQAPSRGLQRFLAVASAGDIDRVVREVLPSAERIMMDMFGNYFMQKLVEVCSPDGRTALIEAVQTRIAPIGMDARGTRVIQKLIEMAPAGRSIQLVLNGVQSCVLPMCLNPFGAHVLQRLLQRCPVPQLNRVHDIIADNFWTIATHTTGCFVLQHCFQQTTPRRLTDRVLANVIDLAQHPHGNYIVQHLLSHVTLQGRVAWALAGAVVHLAVNKFSSNVVEKCLRVAPEEARARLIQELVDYQGLEELVFDSYGNYVIQTALEVAHDNQHSQLCARVLGVLPQCAHVPTRKNIEVTILRSLLGNRAGRV